MKDFSMSTNRNVCKQSIRFSPVFSYVITWSIGLKLMWHSVLFSWFIVQLQTERTKVIYIYSFCTHSCMQINSNTMHPLYECMNVLYECELVWGNIIFIIYWYQREIRVLICFYSILFYFSKFFTTSQKYKIQIFCLLKWLYQKSQWTFFFYIVVAIFVILFSIFH